jgi:quaternary ammonium compound-resistance protein SugE
MAWLMLLVAGLFEVAWAIGLKYTEGFTRLWPSVGTLAAMGLSVLLLGMAMKTLPVGTSYAVWVGVGAVGTAILGIVLFGEPANAGRLVSLGLIPPRQNSCRLHRPTQGAAMKDGLGSIRTDIQRQSGGAIAAARERSDRRGCARGWDRDGHLGALARGCAVQARPRAGLDRGRPT